MGYVRMSGVSDCSEESRGGGCYSRDVTEECLSEKEP